MTKKIDKNKQEYIRNRVKNSYVNTSKKELNKDGMFAPKSRVVGLRITRMF